MSYYFPSDHFTNGQGYRMRYAVQHEYVLRNITSNSCTKISEVNNVCYSQTTAVALTNLGSATTTWLSSPNVSILSSNNTSITVRASNSNSTGNGWVKATLSNGVVLKEEFEVGVPTGYSDGNITIHYSSMDENLFLYNWTRMWIEGYYSGDNWEWTANYSMIRDSGSSQILIKPIALGYITIKVRRKNDCGNGIWISKNYYVTERLEGGHHFRELD